VEDWLMVTGEATRLSMTCLFGEFAWVKFYRQIPMFLLFWILLQPIKLSFASNLSFEGSCEFAKEK